MGLLDSFMGQGWDDPKSQAVMALAGGLLSGDFGAGVQGYGAVMAGAKDKDMERKFKQAQLDNYRSEIAQRQYAQEKQSRLMQMLGFGDTASLGGGSGSPSSVSQMGGGSGVSASGVSASPQGGGRIANMTPDQLAIAKLSGVDLTDVYKLTRPALTNVNGTMVDSTDPGNNNRFVADPKTGMDFQGGRVSLLPGAVETQTTLATIPEQAKANFDLVDVPMGDGTTRKMPRSDAISMLRGNTQIPSVGQRQPTPQEMAMIAADAKANGITNPFVNLSNNASGFGQSQSPLDAAKDAATKEQFVQQAKDIAEQRKSIVNSGFTAGSNIAKYQQLGKLLQDVDGGALTATGTHLASAMNSIGFKIDKNLPNKEAAAALGNEMALELRNPASGAGMPGAMSNSDREYLVSMIPNANQSAQGRRLLIDSAIAVQKRNQQVADFARKYEKKYGKLDNGFFDQMQAWSSANPLFGGQ